MKVVIDTNVIISAFLFGGTPRIILESAFEGTIQAFITDEMIEELETVLRRSKFGLKRRIIQNYLNEVSNLAKWIEPKNKHNVIKQDPDDNKILDCAIEAKTDFIITGDNHLLAIQEYEGIIIINPKDFREKYLAE
jgi:uncharacterized protein